MKKLTNEDLNKKFESPHDFSEKEIDLLFNNNYLCTYCDKSIFEKYSGTCDFPEISVKHNEIKCYECEVNTDYDICPLCENSIHYPLENIIDDKKHYENDKFVPYFYVEKKDDSEGCIIETYKVIEINNAGVFEQKKLRFKLEDISRIFKNISYIRDIELDEQQDICKECESKHKLNEIEV